MTMFLKPHKKRGPPRSAFVFYNQTDKIIEIAFPVESDANESEFKISHDDVEEYSIDNWRSQKIYVPSNSAANKIAASEMEASYSYSVASYQLPKYKFPKNLEGFTLEELKEMNIDVSQYEVRFASASSNATNANDDLFGMDYLPFDGSDSLF